MSSDRALAYVLAFEKGMLSHDTKLKDPHEYFEALLARLTLMRKVCGGVLVNKGCLVHMKYVVASDVNFKIVDHSAKHVYDMIESKAWSFCFADVVHTPDHGTFLRLDTCSGKGTALLCLERTVRTASFELAPRGRVPGTHGLLTVDHEKMDRYTYTRLEPSFVALPAVCTVFEIEGRDADCASSIVCSIMNHPHWEHVPKSDDVWLPSSVRIRPDVALEFSDVPEKHKGVPTEYTKTLGLSETPIVLEVEGSPTSWAAQDKQGWEV